MEVPSTVGLLNLMPAKKEAVTVEQWTRLLGVNTLIKFDDDPRDDEVLQDYQTFSEAVAGGLDALIVTGANLELSDPANPESELLPFSEIPYVDQLGEIMDWAQASTRLTVYSCLASHVALGHLFGLPRERGVYKTFGVYDHEVITDNSLTSGLRTIKSPQSRWGGIATKHLLDADIKVLAESEDAGWLLASKKRPTGVDIFLQGHPEYGPTDLHAEFSRDQKRWPQAPINYYHHNNPALGIAVGWSQDAEQLFGNIQSILSAHE